MIGWRSLAVPGIAGLLLGSAPLCAGDILPGPASAMPGPIFAIIDKSIAAERGVTIGHDGPEFDACAAVGKVRALDPESEEKLDVRAAPDPAGTERDQLSPSTLVWLCEADGEWQGIIYPTGAYQDLGDCQLGSPVSSPEPYTGPCRNGWVQARYIELVAG